MNIRTQLLNGPAFRFLPLLCRHPVRTAVVLLWCLLFATLLQREWLVRSAAEGEVQQAVAAAAGQEYQALLFKGRKLGWIASRYQSEAGGQTLHQQALLRVQSGTEVREVELTLDAEFTADALQSFTLHLVAPPLTLTGVVVGNELRCILEGAGEKRTFPIHFSAPPRLTLARRGWLMEKELKKGDRRRLPGFNFLTMKGSEDIVEYHGKKAVQIDGRMLNLHHFSHQVAGTTLNFWLDDHGATFREEFPAGFSLLRQPEFKAKEMPAQAVKLPGTLSFLAGRLLPALPGTNLFKETK